jgi:hypothetical protein
MSVTYVYRISVTKYDILIRVEKSITLVQTLICNVKGLLTPYTNTIYTYKLIRVALITLPNSMLLCPRLESSGFPSCERWLHNHRNARHFDSNCRHQAMIWEQDTAHSVIKVNAGRHCVGIIMTPRSLTCFRTLTCQSYLILYSIYILWKRST